MKVTSEELSTEKALLYANLDLQILAWLLQEKVWRSAEETNSNKLSDFPIVSKVPPFFWLKMLNIFFSCFLA